MEVEELGVDGEIKSIKICESGRNYGFDILRCLSMLGIIGLHIMNAGGVKQNYTFGTIDSIGIEFIYILLLSSVNVFAMLSGYLYAKKASFTYARILQLILTCAFYCFIITGVFWILCPDIFMSLGTYIIGLFPPIFGKYWYIVCYVFVFFMMPYINKLLQQLSKREFKSLLIVLWGLLSLIPTFGLYDYFRTDFGYSPWWLMACYIGGAYLRLYDIKIRRTKIIFFFSLLGTVALWVLISSVEERVFGSTSVRTILFEEYTSPFVVWIAIMLVLIFRDIHVKESLNKFIIWISACTFGVYIIHAHPLVMQELISDNFGFLAEYPLVFCVISFMGVCIGIFAICTIIESVRMVVFRKIKLIKRSINFLGKKLENLLDSSKG